jgi:Leucine-rich repeat (LRR) protein
MPTELNNLSDLNFIELTGAALSGTISGLNQLHGLTKLDLSGNQFTGR